MPVPLRVEIDEVCDANPLWAGAALPLPPSPHSGRRPVVSSRAILPRAHPWRHTGRAAVGRLSRRTKVCENCDDTTLNSAERSAHETAQPRALGWQMLVLVLLLRLWLRR